MKGSANPGGLAEGCLGGIRGLVFVPNLGLVAWSGPELEILLLRLSLTCEVCLSRLRGEI